MPVASLNLPIEKNMKPVLSSKSFFLKGFKMKRKLFLTFSIFLIIFLFSACSPAEEEMKNPMEEMASLDAIEEQLGFTFESLPKDAENINYFTIARTIAQADFLLDSIDYTARKALISEDDISGVYLNLENGQTMIDDRGNNVFYEYNKNGEGLATWSDDTYDYSLFCPKGFDLETLESIVQSIS